MRKIIVLYLICGALNTILALPGDTIFFDNFENDTAWTPRAGMVTKVVNDPDSGKVMRITGKQESAWNYASSKNFLLQAGHKYRFTSLLYIDTLSPLFAPYFKVEYTENGSGIDRVSSSKYIPVVGGWQELFMEFECIAQANGGWIAVEKGTNNSVYIDALVDNVFLVEIKDFTPHPYHFDTIPAPLDSLSTHHPRLYLTTEKFADLKSKINTEPYASLLSELLYVANGGVDNGPPTYIVGTDEEQLWQRPVGNMMPHLAMAYRLTDDQKYLVAAKQFMLASAGYPTWGLGNIDGSDLATGHQLYGLALAYDWLYNYLDSTTLDSVRNCLLSRGEFMFEKLLNEDVWWHDSYLQNHQWVNMTGLCAAGLALFGDTSDIDGWILLPLKKFKTTMTSLGPDGASHEGIPYWSYGVEYMLKFMELARDLLEEDLYADNEWFMNTYLFRLYGMLPRSHSKLTSSLMTFGDGPRYDWYGPDHLLRRLASQYDNGNAEWLADELSKAKAGLSGSHARFMNIIWADPSVTSQSPDNLPLLKHFSDMDIVYMRSGWHGRESLSAFKCGPHIGHHAINQYSYDPGGGHVHPDAGAFQIFSHGDWLIVDDGYTLKTTAYQNTALINEIGQEGEGAAWFSGSLLCQQNRGAKIVRVDTTKKYDYIIGDVTAAYKKETGLKEFLRHVLFIRPNCWIIADEFTTETASLFESYLHADFPFEQVDTNRCKVEGDSGALFITSIKPYDGTLQTWKQQIIGTGGGEKDSIPALKIYNKIKSSKRMFITMLEAYPTNSSPIFTSVIKQNSGDEYISFQTPDTNYTFRLNKDRIDRTAPLFVDTSLTPIKGKTFFNLNNGVEISARITSGKGVIFNVTLPENGEFLITAYNAHGRKLFHYRKDNAVRGSHLVQWHSQGYKNIGAGSGVYFISLRYRDTLLMKKLVYVKK